MYWGSKTKATRTHLPEAIRLGGLNEPIRAKIFGLERLEQRAESLVAAQTVSKGAQQGRPLIPRVLENGRVLLDSYRAIARAVKEDRAITPAAE